MKCFKVCSTIVMIMCIILATVLLFFMNYGCCQYCSIYKLFIICNYVLAAIMGICNLIACLCGDNTKAVVRKYKVEKLTDVFCEFENIPYQTEPRENENTQLVKKHISPRLMGEIDKEVFKAYANAMADI